jgi:hypothetical protein
MQVPQITTMHQNMIPNNFNYPMMQSNQAMHPQLQQVFKQVQQQPSFLNLFQ